MRDSKPVPNTQKSNLSGYSIDKPSNGFVGQMKIHDDHLYHGAALNQIAEHKQFTSINALDVKGQQFNNTYEINKAILVHLKYATKPKGSLKEYQFTFSTDQLKLLATANTHANKFVIGLVCVHDREICALPYPELIRLINVRQAANGAHEDQYVLLLSLPKDSSFRVCMAEPGRRGKSLTKELKVARNKFPNSLFE